MLDNLKERIGSVVDNDAFTELYEELRHLESSKLFEAVWSLAISEPIINTPPIASYLLVKLDLPTDRKCEDMLGDMRDRRWDPSNRIIPFYLVTKFGKQQVTDSVERMVNEQADETDRKRIEGVGYWVKQSAESLIEPLHYFEWQEAIERENHSRPIDS